MALTAGKAHQSLITLMTQITVHHEAIRFRQRLRRDRQRTRRKKQVNELPTFNIEPIRLRSGQASNVEYGIGRADRFFMNPVMQDDGAKRDK
jgi:hypothetical protein